MKKLPLLLIFSLWICQFATAQTNPIFDDTSLPEIRITIDRAYLDQLLAEGNENNDEEFPANFHFKSATFEATELNIGFRLRGNTSRVSAKKSFKVSFNTFEKGRDLEGFEKLNLNGEHNDPSIMRSKISWDLMQQMGVAAPRANHVKLFVNNEYKGLYMNVEHIDEEFADDRFGKKSGNLYKCLYPADLTYKGEDPNLYKTMSGGRRSYELTTNEEEDDYTDLANFIKMLNKTPLQDLETELEKVFDVNSFVKVLAVEVMTGHWDNYGSNQNNFYLLHNPVDDKFYYIPYDLDNTIGIDFFPDTDRTTVDMYKWYDESKNRPLVKRIMSVQRYRELFSIYMEQLLDYYKPNALFPRIDELKEMITEAAESDTYKSLDYGFTNEDFHTSYTNSLPEYGFVRFGVKEFISKRYANTADQLVITSSEIAAAKGHFYPNPTDGLLSLDFPAEDYTVFIRGIDGRVFLTHAYKGEESKIDFTGKLPAAGLYILQLQDSQGIVRSHRFFYQP